MIVKCIAKSKINPAIHLVVSGPHKTPVDCSDDPRIEQIKVELAKSGSFPISTPLPTPTPAQTPESARKTSELVSKVFAQTLEQQDPNGPGTKLSQMLEKLGIKSAPNCSCKARAKLMNEKGFEWCEQNIDVIVGWLREEAQKRNLPFIDIAGKIIVKRAISQSKKAKQNEQK